MGQLPLGPFPVSEISKDAEDNPEKSIDIDMHIIFWEIKYIFKEKVTKKEIYKSINGYKEKLHTWSRLDFESILHSKARILLTYTIIPKS